MATKLSIEWTESTWNPVTGCNKISSGCPPEADYAERNALHIDDLRSTGSQVKFLSVEQLIGPISRNDPSEKLKLSNIQWVIVGGESGPKARPMKEEWVLAPKESIRNIKDQCKSTGSFGEAGVPFFFSQRDGKPKQWGGINKKKTGRLLEGRTWDELPVLRVG